MGAGKSSVGKIISRNLKMNFYDLDDEIEKRNGIAISEIFEKHGESYFRDIETETLKEIAQKSRQVVSTGGGIVLRDENWDVLNGNGITVYLRAPVDELWSRIKKDINNETLRPLLNVKNPLGKMKELLSERRALYEKAHIIIDADNVTPENVAEIVIEKLSYLN